MALSAVPEAVGRTIAHIDTERSWRGGQQQVLSLIRGLTARGHRNLAVVRKSSALATRLKAEGLPILEVQPWGEWDFLAAHVVNRWLKKNRVEVVHAHSAHGTALAALATLGTDIPAVATRRVDFPLSDNLFTKWKYRRLRRVIAISNKVRDVLISSGIDPVRIALVNSGVDFERYRHVKPVSLGDLGVPGGHRVVGQVAALADHKDQNTFLNALAQLFREQEDVHGVLVGDGEKRAALESVSRALGISDRVHFLGYREDALSCLAAFDVFCLSSKQEGLGTSILDALALGIPVVATRAGGIPEMIRDGVNGVLVDPQNPRSLAEALSQVLSDRKKAIYMAEAGREVAKQFEIGATVRGTEAVYSQIVLK